MTGGTDNEWSPMLARAVPAAITAVTAWDPARRVKEADSCADVIASGADLLWADTSPADTGLNADQVREAIVTGLAILAHRPGGVRFGGLHWHVDPCGPGCPGPGTCTIPGPGISRQERGAVFTPRALAEDVAANALAVLIQEATAGDIEGFQVADIACGSGAFLVAAARYLGEAINTRWDDQDKATARRLYGTDDASLAARAAVITRCLYGVDIDPLSIELTGLALQLLAPTIPPPEGQVPGLRVGDALVGRARPDDDVDVPARAARFDWPEVFPEVFTCPGGLTGFDAVIGNPPFLAGLKLTSTLGEAYREHLVTAVAGGTRGCVDLAVYFWLRAHALTHHYGVVAVIGPDSMLRGTARRVGHDQLARRGWRPYRQITAMTWPTRAARLSCCVAWTHQLADPPEECRNLPDDSPRGTFYRTVLIDGAPMDIYRYTPATDG